MSLKTKGRLAVAHAFGGGLLFALGVLAPLLDGPPVLLLNIPVSFICVALSYQNVRDISRPSSAPAEPRG